MKRDTLLRLGVVLILMLAGGLLWRWQVASPDAPAVTLGENFRVWLWDMRGLDVVVQVGLLFVGALGITALLPESAEEAPPQ